MRRWTAFLIVAVVVTLVLILGAQAASAREILGCDGIVQWPCPGPVIFSP